jgi:hypothetical protein
MDLELNLLSESANFFSVVCIGGNLLKSNILYAKDVILITCCPAANHSNPQRSV